MLIFSLSLRTQQVWVVLRAIFEMKEVVRKQQTWVIYFIVWNVSKMPQESSASAFVSKWKFNNNDDDCTTEFQTFSSRFLLNDSEHDDDLVD